MAGLTDMEELIATVPERNIADYLREAMSCYGAGAHRACVVLSHIALFDGLRQKLLAIAPVNSVAKGITDEIEPLANGQKVFETPLIHKMKGASIITQLEADILEQINRQRNKAAHPSGHEVTAEEARFVFSEVIQKFLSQPIRQTSVVVDQIIAKLGDANFFPSSMLPDMTAVVDQETANLHESAMPALFSKLVQAYESADATAKLNATRFLLALAARREPSIRKQIIKYVIDPKCSNDANAEFVTQIATCDATMLGEFKVATKMRCKALFLKNAQAIGVRGVYNELRHPAHLLSAAVSALGAPYLLSDYSEFTDWVIAQAPVSPEFVTSMALASDLFASLQSQYLARASSSQWDTSNPFANALPSMDGVLTLCVTDEWAFRLAVAVARGADWGGFGPLQITSSKFQDLPGLKPKAVAFAQNNPADAAPIITSSGLNKDLPTFLSEYLI